MTIYADNTTAVDANAVARELTAELESGAGSFHADKESLKQALSVGAESRTAEAQTLLGQLHEGAESVGRSVYGASWDTLTAAQKKMFKICSTAWGDGFNAFNRSAMDIAPSAESAIPSYVAGDTYINPDMKLSPGAEAYDARQLMDAKVATTVINVGSAVQDEFAEAFFPTVVLPPNEGNVRFEVEKTFVMTDYLHTGDGSTGVPDGFGSVSIIDAIVNPAVLRDSSIDVIPIYSASNTAFTSEVDPFDHKGVETGALKFNQDIDLLAISSDNLLNPSQVLDSTDQLDHDVRIDSVFAKITDGSGNEEIFRIPLAEAPGANFAPHMARTTARGLTLSYASKTIPIHGNLKPVGAGPNDESVTLAFLRDPTRADWVVYLDLNVSGTADLETGNIRVNSSPSNIASVWQQPVNTDEIADHIQINDAAQLNEVMNNLPSIELVGWFPHATRTNLNRRTRGILARTDIASEQYTIPLGPPISVLTPVVDTETLVDLEAPIKLNRIRNSQNAVRTLLAYGDRLQGFANSYSIRAPRPEIRSIGRHIMRPYSHVMDLDLTDAVDSIRSADRLADVNYSIMAVVRHMVTKAWSVSGFGAAWTAMGIEGKPTVVIGCNVEIGSYLTLAHQEMALGALFDVKIVTTQNREMENNIVIGFTSGTGKEVFTFGNFYYMPEIVSTLPKTTNGGQSIQLTVQNRNMHLCHIPVQLRIRLKGLEKVLTSKIPVKTVTHVVERT